MESESASMNDWDIIESVDDGVPRNLPENKKWKKATCTHKSEQEIKTAKHKMTIEEMELTEQSLEEQKDRSTTSILDKTEQKITTSEEKVMTEESEIPDQEVNEQVEKGVVETKRICMNGWVVISSACLIILGILAFLGYIIYCEDVRNKEEVRKSYTNNK